jgi:hypothetical protein
VRRVGEPLELLPLDTGRASKAYGEPGHGSDHRDQEHNLTHGLDRVRHDDGRIGRGQLVQGVLELEWQASIWPQGNDGNEKEDEGKDRQGYDRPPSARGEAASREGEDSQCAEEAATASVPAWVMLARAGRRIANSPPTTEMSMMSSAGIRENAVSPISPFSRKMTLTAMMNTDGDVSPRPSRSRRDDDPG